MFHLLAQKGKARRGQGLLPHGVVETPCFMPIATKGAVKTLTFQELEEGGTQMLLSNTYHLLLRPGRETMQTLGGWHALTGWNKPLLTDSGGYQVFSLSKLNKTTEEGVAFQSHLDGSRIFLTPESSMEMQQAIGADIAMCFDDVAAGGSTYERHKEAMERSLRWAARSKQAMTNAPLQKLFGIIQGGTYEDLRERSLQGLGEIGFDGYAIGGLSVGEPREDAYRIVSFLSDRLPKEAPRYFMGGGMPEEIVFYVSQGVDLFDCVLPSRNARHGLLFTWSQDPAKTDWSACPTDFYQKMHITNEGYRLDASPIDPWCDCFSCRTCSRAYLHHLFRVGELSALRLATIHNLRFYHRLMESLREWIVDE
jgi:queuine tRNA-ribosyltransferase